MSSPLVSCLCCTYGRPLLLGEAIKCFMDQDYPNKELIILNDQEGVNLKINYNKSDIIVHNIPKRFKSLGEKEIILKDWLKGNIVAYGTMTICTLLIELVSQLGCLKKILHLIY